MSIDGLLRVVTGCYVTTYDYQWVLMIMGIIMIINGYYQWVLISTFGPWYKSLDLYLVNFLCQYSTV